ncbi:MAG: hypothetical protein K9H49_00730 [Bacteroidales bacterium]|nr:hypothetical protein [Bacteroidales bacterium]MCF8389441.1 hypothetical protein [Bacteroidales bacterium]
MFYQLFVYLNLLGIFLFSWFIDQEINVKLSVPTEVQAGESFRVDIIIEKGDLESFSRYIQDLPYGLTAERVTSANADFSFEDQRIRLIWIKLPAENTLSVSYNINVDKRLKGSFELKGDFAFVEENQRRNMEVSAEHMINIIPSPELADSLIVDIKDFEQMLRETGQTPDSFNKLAVLRSPPVKSGNYQYTVELLVKKGDLSKFAKIEEQIPAGYRAVEGDSQEGIFSFSRGVAKILWMNLPLQSEFSITYNIIPDPGYAIENLTPSGTFSYITGNATEIIAIEQKKDDLADYFIERDTAEIEASDTVADSEVADVIVQESNETEKIDPVADVKKTEVSFDESASEGDILQPQAGIYYRVQLSAGHTEVDIEKYFRARKISDEVKMEYHDGWRKYSTGSFNVYKDARDYRVKIWETTPIHDAFVSAYSDGRRITVQEALMVTNNKWYR